ncbi:MAG: TRAM domain-containing protein [Victivallaceae bacterium]|nr:TRAM domain-containing protein [Victivallaceae bacterium]
MKREKITIRDFAFGGEAVGNLADGRVAFVRGAIPGETVEIEITAGHKKYVRGKLTEIVSASAERIGSDCPCFADCPGCAYRHVPYGVELAAKNRQLASFLNRNRDEKCEILPPVGAASRNHWRNRLRLHSDGGGKFGYRAMDNTTLLEIGHCPLATKNLNERIARLTLPDGFRGTFALDDCAERGAVCDFDNELPETLTGKLGDFGTFCYRRGGFFQTNEAIASELARRVIEEVKIFAPDFLLELFCGVGVFSILAARALPALRSVGVEFDRHAVRYAVRNAKNFRVAERCAFFAGDAADAPQRYASFGKRLKTLVIVDPPRTGLGRKLTQSLLQSAPGAILYVSCGADTLRRDLDELAPGFVAVHSTLLDMFPGTAHFESLTLLKKRDTAQ